MAARIKGKTMAAIRWVLVAVVAAGLLVVVGCSEHKRHTTIEERTTTTTEGGPVISGNPAPCPSQPGTIERTETREERTISREPVVK